jgi:hypothetical protein
MRHAPSPGPDGFADDVQHGPRLVAGGRLPPDPYDAALDALTRALIVASAVRARVPVPDETQILACSYARFRYVARQALTLVDSGLVWRAKAEAIQDVADQLDTDVLGDEARLARLAIEQFEARLAALSVRGLLMRHQFSWPTKGETVEIPSPEGVTS